jgi:hypothetical protein
MSDWFVSSLSRKLSASQTKAHKAQRMASSWQATPRGVSQLSAGCCALLTDQYLNIIFGQLIETTCY